ncbi:hypothetical protein [Sphingomonas sp. LHG3406-1]|uniref:hypothetical protein n=1 Tax=Sphingomonas sp. LHG3406-1 TaxID=2804617 RepID=UPI0026104869|nr:hypothetical protein [Sphingomonas sp. LHG3406-1]
MLVEAFTLATDPTREVFDEAARLGDHDDKASLTLKAERCRRLAAGVSDRQAADVLNGMARGYQAAADRFDQQD